MRSQNTLADRIGYHPEQIISEFGQVPHVVPQAASELQQMTEYYNDNYLKEPQKENQMNLMLITATFLPIFGLLIMPKWIKDVLTKKEELVEEEEIVLFN